MKKNSYYFSLLSEVEQGQYRENFNNLSKLKITFEEYLDLESINFGQFLSSSFLWGNTPKENQGFNYWFEISNRPEPTDQIVLVQFIPSLAEIEAVLKSDKFKKYSFKDLAYSLSVENILDIIIELQKPKP
jgi:hypothetical protein